MGVKADVGGSRGERPTRRAEPQTEGHFTLSPESGQSIDFRLAAIAESIRKWDWRTADVTSTGKLGRPRPTAAGGVKALRPPRPAPAPDPHWHLVDPEPQFSRAPVQAPMNAPAPLVDPLVRQPFGPPLGQPLPSTRPVPTPDFEPRSQPEPQPQPQQTMQQASPLGGHTAPVPIVETAQRPSPDTLESSESEPDTAPPAPGRLAKFKVLLWLIPVVVVVLIVAIIRMQSPGQTSGDLTPTSVTGSTATTIPVTSAVKSQFSSASTKLNASNTAVTHAFADNSSETVAQVAQAVTPYVTALNAFDSEIHSVAWPPAMQVPSETLQVRTQDLVTFLSSISSTTTATLSTWFTQLHTLAAQTQAADNLVRTDIGLAPTTSYP